MPLFSKQIWYCNACGRQQTEAPSKAVGRTSKCCSIECHREMEWRETLSVLGKDYYPRHANTEA